MGLYRVVPADLPSEITKSIIVPEVDQSVVKKELPLKKKSPEKPSPSTTSKIEQKSMFDLPPVTRPKNKLNVDINLSTSEPKKSFEVNSASPVKKEEIVKVNIKVEI